MSKETKFICDTCQGTLGRQRNGGEVEGPVDVTVVVINVRSHSATYTVDRHYCPAHVPDWAKP